MSDEFPYANVNPNMMSREEFERFMQYQHAQKYPKGCGTNWASGCDDCVERLWEESKEKES
jgi:hypothetical protein